MSAVMRAKGRRRPELNTQTLHVLQSEEVELPQTKQIDDLLITVPIGVQ